MIDDGWLLMQRAELDALNAELNGMIALNYYRISRGETIAYMEEHFQEKADEIREIATLIAKNR